MSKISTYSELPVTQLRFGFRKWDIVFVTGEYVFGKSCTQVTCLRKGKVKVKTFNGYYLDLFAVAER